MDTSPNNTVAPGKGGSGLSRAAKKRAKKNKSKASSNFLKRPPSEPDAYEEPKKAKLDSEEIFERDATVRKSGGDDEPHVPDAALTEILLLTEINDTKKKEIIENFSTKERAQYLLQAIIDPIPLEQFYEEYWEKKPLLVRAQDGNRNRYDNLLSLESIRELSQSRDLVYARDLNVTRYERDEDGVKRRRTFDKLPTDEQAQDKGIKVNPKELWSRYENGCTIRLLCPHKHSDNIHALLSTLEQELHCMVGANAYLTPPNASQGFAPHYDDIEAFCLQLQGIKRWKVYEPTFSLPRVSSEDFVPSDLEGKEPLLDVTLQEGDLLYMPRGWIHQACTLKAENKHSLHLTISAMQQWAWADLLEIILPEALEAAVSSEKSSSLRQGLPRGFLEYMGAMYEEPSDEKLPDSLKRIGDEEANENPIIQRRRELQIQFRADAKKKIMKVAKTAHDMLDVACDEIAKRFLSDRQPFVLTEHERSQTAKADEDRQGGDKEILPNTLCRLVRPGIARLVIEDDRAIVYHCGDNAREFQGQPLSPLEFETDDGPALEQLLTTVEPHWIFVNDLFHDTIEDKVAIAQSLYDEGILAVTTQKANQD